jgi:hypothetical protein
MLIDILIAWPHKLKMITAFPLFYFNLHLDRDIFGPANHEVPSWNFVSILIDICKGNSCIDKCPEIYKQKIICF